MKAMTRQELADCAGVSVRTLANWCRPYQDELWMMGLRPRMKVLTAIISSFFVQSCKAL